MTDICQVCGLPLEVGEYPCVYTVRPHERPVMGLKQIGDEIDEWHENITHEPIHITSRAEKRRLLKEHGLQEFVRHVGTPGEGSDKSKMTTRWF